MYSSKTIRDALQEGTRKGYRLFPEMREAAEGANPYTGQLATDILHTAEEVCSKQLEPITYEIFTEYARSGGRERYDRLLSQRLFDLAVLGIAAVLDKDSVWINAVQERMWELCNLYIWELNAIVSLDVSAYGKHQPDPRETIGLLTAETAFQLTEMLHILGPRLDPFLVYRVKREVTERVFQPYLRYPFWWQSAATNWQSVCSASIGCAALYMIEDEDKLGMLLGRIMQGLQSYLEGFDAEGVTTEGLDYWVYGFSSFVFFAELLQERTAGRIRLLEDQAHTRAIAAFPKTVMLSGGSVVNFSDCGEQASLPNYLSARLGQRFGTTYGYIQTGTDRVALDIGTRWSYLTRSLFWMGTEKKTEQVGPAEGMTFMAASQWLVDKRLIGPNKLLAFAAKGGHNDEPHNHNDLGHFILHVAGKNVMPDLGAPEYTRSTFSKERYENLLTSSRGHAVPTINGKVQSPGRERLASVVHCLDDGTKVRYKLQLAEAYEAPELQSYTREWEWNYTTRTLQLKDTFTFESADHEITETLLFRDEPRVLRPGVMQVDADVCVLNICYPETAVVQITKETYRVRLGNEASVYLVTMTNRCSGVMGSFELLVQITVIE
jgi:hypothetical protein